MQAPETSVCGCVVGGLWLLHSDTPYQVIHSGWELQHQLVMGGATNIDPYEIIFVVELENYIACIFGLQDKTAITFHLVLDYARADCFAQMTILALDCCFVERDDFSCFCLGAPEQSNFYISQSRTGTNLANMFHVQEHDLSKSTNNKLAFTVG